MKDIIIKNVNMRCYETEVISNATEDNYKTYYRFIIEDAITDSLKFKQYFTNGFLSGIIFKDNKYFITVSNRLILHQDKIIKKDSIDTYDLEFLNLIMHLALNTLKNIYAL